MADSEAVRSRRKRLHAAGDHSMCRRCQAVTGKVALPPPAAALPSPAPVAELDATTEMRSLAQRLAAEHERHPDNALIARELRMTLRELMPKGTGDSELDEFLAEFSRA